MLTADDADLSLDHSSGLACFVYFVVSERCPTGTTEPANHTKEHEQTAPRKDEPLIESALSASSAVKYLYLLEL
jgi:hypothetical protein